MVHILAASKHRRDTRSGSDKQINLNQSGIISKCRAGNDVVSNFLIF